MSLDGPIARSAGTLHEWTPISHLTPLEPDQVQVWRIDLTSQTGQLPALFACLTDEEQNRAHRLREGEPHQQFVVGRGCLRLLLGTALSIPPRDVPLVVSPFGKPELAAAIEDRLTFNVAHSRQLLLVALCRSGAIGVDLEHIDDTTDWTDVANLSFTAREAQAIAALPDPRQRSLAFYRCWTRKEAVIKADGRGLSLPMSSFEVPVDLGDKDRPLHSAPLVIAGASATCSSTYYITDLPLGEGLAAAVALDSGNGHLRLFSFPLPLQSGESLGL